MEKALDESTLVQAAQAGDVAAFNRLVVLHEQRIYSLAYRMLSDSDEAADVTQDVFIAAYRYLPHFKGGSLRAWLCRVATNACYDHLRLRMRRPSTSLDAMVDAEDNPAGGLPDHGETPEDFSIRHELATDLQIALNQLPPEQRAVSILFDVQGFSLEEVSLSLGIPMGTVKSRLSRARARLREFLLTNRAELFSPAQRSDSSKLKKSTSPPGP